MFCLRRFLKFRVLDIHFFSIILVISSTRAEFRFCHQGPQKFRNSDCPYGVLFKNPVPATCVFYANDQSGPSGEAELQGCNSPAKPLPAAGEKVENFPFQAMFVDISDPNDKGELGNLGGECEAECLEQWKSLDERGDGDDEGPLIPAPPEEPEYDDMAPALTDDESVFHRNLTAQLFQTLLEDDPGPQLSYMRSAKLLRRSFEILRQICQPFIPEEFTDQIFKGFMYLVLKSDEKVLDVGHVEKQEIDEALSRCAGSPARVTIKGTICNNYTRITGYSYIGNDSQEAEQPYVIKPKSYRWKKYDPFIEGAWAALDFVHGYCYPAHEPNLNFHHIYEAGLEPLFTRTVMQRWPYPPELKRGDSYWNNLLEAKDAKTMMQNLDACVQAAYHGSVHTDRLNRPFNKFSTTIGDPSSGASASTKSNPSLRKGGWSGTVEDYWTWYSSSDALNHYLNSMGGTCIKTESDLSAMRAQYDQLCAPP